MCHVMSRVGASSVRDPPSGEFFPHFAPPELTRCFIGGIGAEGRFGLVLVEECGVQWGVVE
jgi:hypothetical protein